MLVTTLILPLLVAAPRDCYLVTNHDIQRIPCNFSASTTDALRYGQPGKPDQASPAGAEPPRFEEPRTPTAPPPKAYARTRRRAGTEE